MKLRFNVILVPAMLALTCLPAFSDDLAILRNGSEIRHERRETVEGATRLYLPGARNNFVDIPADQIVRFEKVEELPAPPEVPAASPAPAPAPAHVPTFQELVSAASNHNRIDPDLIISMIRAESGFDPKAVSPKGAQGLMQLMPRTAAELGVENAMDPAANVDGGTRYLRELLEKYNNDLVKALAAYNAGPERVEQYHGVPPYPETLRYIVRIINDLNRRKLAEARAQSKGAAKSVAKSNPKTSTPGAPPILAAGHGSPNPHM